MLESYKELDKSYRERLEKEFSGRIRLTENCGLDFCEENLASVVLVYKDAVDTCREAL